MYTAVCVDLDDIEANCALEGFGGTDYYVLVVVDFFLFSCDNVVVMTQENVFVDENFFVLHIQYHIYYRWDRVFTSHVLNASTSLDVRRILPKNFFSSVGIRPSS
ncbi:MAG: hypothetical protein M3044_01175 [Thermoproteota archaeon]|nr:hypothetical protein [Thermoproteota archaeon]